MQAVSISPPRRSASPQLRSGEGTVGKGRLAAVSGKGTLKLKLAKKLKKGKYTLDPTGKDAAGTQRTTAASLTVR